MQFSDATSTTQGRYTNVSTVGSTVWDPHAPKTPSTEVPSAKRWDDLPAFASLTSDEERERKAEIHRPGTFSVVTTPGSFSSLPEYASSIPPSGRRPSVQSSQGSVGSPASCSGRSKAPSDPYVVVLDRFEEASTPTSTSYPISVPPRGPSMPDAMRNLTITAAPPVPRATFMPDPYTRIQSSDDHLTAHFRRSILRRLTQPVLEEPMQHGLVPRSTRDVFELEATRFRPLHHAICAISALNLSYNGRASLEEALQHYQSALSAPESPTTAEELVSDGVFLRHFLLFIYDICVPMDADHGGDVMWAQHLNHLRSISLQRHRRFGRERYGYVLWSICELDLYACLLGSGDCEFANTIIENGMVPPLEAQVPAAASSSSYLPAEIQVFPIIQGLHQGVIMSAIKIAQQAQQFRTISIRPSPGAQARLQAGVIRLQHEILTSWARSYPEFLGPESPQAGYSLPPRVRYVFEHAFLLHQASIIYLRTSMFPAQRSIPVADQGEVHADTERRCISILTLASSYLDGELMLERRHAVFPVFMAGVSTTQPDAKVQAIDIIKAMERGAIGQNTYRTRQLLVVVCEEQRRVVSAGGRMETVDWLAVARERGLSVVNCGL
ncbi:hypothetical protein LTR53_002944 [Teratosphaeriaceae sp. CCFEE 6253]|nr:hypothetical protein LTR53_002944 [Teratosphaeriaceae sp. CCFEE 6253]